MSLPPNDRVSSRALEHPALVYRDLDEFLAYTVPFVEHGVARGEPVFGAIGPSELAALRAAVGSAGDVRLANTNAWHPVPATRLRAFHRFVTDALELGAVRVRLVGEPLWPTDPPGAAPEWARYESVGTEQRAGRGLWLARQVVDLMQIAGGAGGNSVRLQIRIDRRGDLVDDTPSAE